MNQTNASWYNFKEYQMPYMTNGRRDYKKELNWEKTQATNRAKDRVARVLARREVEKTTGNLPESKHVDHIKPITEGGSPRAKSNLRVISGSANLQKEALRKQRAKR